MNLKSLLALLFLLSFGSLCPANETLKALIVDGQNNHGVWPKTTKMMKKYLEESGLFSVDVATTEPKGTDKDYRPEFAKYDVVVSNYNGAPWPKNTQQDFVQYMKNGGGLVVVHAADNAFGTWKEYNEMIGLGGWGGRNEKSGPYVYYNEDGEVVRDSSKGRGGSHGAQHPFAVIVRNTEHPITKGMPKAWLHEKDELYDKLRGPAKNMEVLATAYASKDKGGTGRHEPMMMTISYGKGRVFHTPMGHGDYSQECVGFIVSLQRGAEWAATGKVTQDIPADFPTLDEVSKRPFTEDAAKIKFMKEMVKGGLAVKDQLLRQQQGIMKDMKVYRDGLKDGVVFEYIYEDGVEVNRDLLSEASIKRGMLAELKGDKDAEFALNQGIFIKIIYKSAKGEVYGQAVIDKDDLD